MRLPKLILIFSFMIASFTSLFGEPNKMDGAGLESTIREVIGEDGVAAQGNIVEFEFRGVPLVCIYDEAHNRMRIISPVLNYTEVTDLQKDRMLESNFHSALDARYATSHGVLYAAYIHPLGSLNKRDVMAAIYQVASLHLSFGTEYSSGILSFGEGTSDPDPEDLT